MAIKKNMTNQKQNAIHVPRIEKVFFGGGSPILQFFIAEIRHEFEEGKFTTTQPVFVNVSRGNVITKDRVLVRFWQTHH